jgi:hypothetical protein
VKIETAAAVLTVTVVETLASVVVVAMADGDGGWRKVSNGSGSDSGYHGGRQQQKWRGQATMNKRQKRIKNPFKIGLNWKYHSYKFNTKGLIGKLDCFK